VSRQYKPKAGFWIRLCVVVLFPIDSLLFRIRWHNLARMTPPSEGGVIIALNHVSHIDTVLMARMVWSSGRVPRFMIKAGMFTKPLLGQIMRGAAQIPVHRGTTDAAASLDDAVTALARGEAVVIYPEGTITKDPAPTKGFNPLRLFRRRLAEASVGDPVDLSGFRGAQPDAATLRKITDTIMSAVRDEVAALRGEPAPTEFFKPAKKFVENS